GLIQQGISSRLLDLFERTVNVRPLSEGFLATLNSKLELAGSVSLQPAMLGERVYFLDCYRAQKQGKMTNSQWGPRELAVRYLPGTLELSASNILDCYAALIEAAGMRTAAGGRRLKSIEKQFSSEPWYSTMPCAWLSGQVAMQRKYWAEIASFRVALAGER